MADEAWREAQRLAWVGVMRMQKLRLVAAVLARHADGASLGELADVAQDVLDATHATMNSDAADLTRHLLDGAAPRALQ